MIGIYKIESISFPNKIYIGSSVNIEKRWAWHKSSLKHNHHSNNKMQYHVNKYGIDDLKITVLIECNKEELIQLEQYFMDFNNPYFNLDKKAGLHLGNKRVRKVSKEDLEFRKGTRKNGTKDFSFKENDPGWNSKNNKDNYIRRTGKNNSKYRENPIQWKVKI